MESLVKFCAAQLIEVLEGEEALGGSIGFPSPEAFSFCRSILFPANYQDLPGRCCDPPPRHGQRQNLLYSRGDVARARGLDTYCPIAHDRDKVDKTEQILANPRLRHPPLDHLDVHAEAAVILESASGGAFPRHQNGRSSSRSTPARDTTSAGGDSASEGVDPFGT